MRQNYAEQPTTQASTTSPQQFTHLAKFSAPLLDAHPMKQNGIQQPASPQSAETTPTPTPTTTPTPAHAQLLSKIGNSTSPETANLLTTESNKQNINQNNQNSHNNNNNNNNNNIGFNTTRFYNTGRQDPRRSEKFESLLKQENIDLDQLKKLSWNGIPDEMRALTWRLLLGYAPTNKSRRQATLDRKRKEYLDLIPKLYEIDESLRSSEQTKDFKQIALDMPRTIPASKIFQSNTVQELLGRLLYIFAARHPASGYVQGMNDLAAPFVVVFLAEVVEGDVNQCDPATVDPAQLATVEADAYWCVTKLLDSIQDNFTFAQPGIQKMVHKHAELIKRINSKLYDHIVQTHDIQFIQFAYTWMNCLLLRELPLHHAVRIWDTYFAEGEDFPAFHVYTCASFLMSFATELMEMDFQEILMLLKSPPTNSWSAPHIESMLAQAYVWKSTYESSHQLTK